MARGKKWYVYILQLKDNTYYTGITNDIANRLQMHREGKGSKYVRSRLPLKLVFLEESSGRSEASKREREIKKFNRIRKIALIAQNYYQGEIK